MHTFTTLHRWRCNTVAYAYISNMAVVNTLDGMTTLSPHVYRIYTGYRIEENSVSLLAPSAIHCACDRVQ